MMRSGYRRNIFRNKAERPLLLLFPGCNCNDAASAMRIRKGLARLGGNASARGASNASTALTASPEQHDTIDEFLPVENAEKSCVNVQERVVVMSEAATPSWTRAERSPTPPDRPYMNLDEFVNSLARKNCFPDEEFDYVDHRHKTGESSGMIKFPGASDDRFTLQFSRMDSGSSIKNADDVDTCLRLAISPRETAPAGDPAKRIKGGNVLMNTEDTEDGRRVQDCTTTTVSVAIIGSALEAGETSLAHPEAHGQSYQMAQITSIPESTEVEVEAGQPDQTMKSSTESMERRPRRASRSTGRKRGRLPSPAATDEEQTDNVDQEEEASSDYSSQRARTRKRKRKRSVVSVSSSTLATQDSEKRKQRSGLRTGESASKRTKTSKKERKGSNPRSGRPKKLKYMKQDNTEELGNQCNRSDGKGWTCPLLAKTGYQLCDHHLDKLRCKPGSRSKYNKKKGPATLS